MSEIESSEEEELIADAVREMAEANVERAEAVAEAADAASIESLARAAANIAAAAETVGTLAEVHAVDEINRNKESMEWLRQHATTTENSLNELRQALPQALQAQSETINQLQAQLTALQVQLTPPPSMDNSTENEEPEEVLPQSQSEAQDAQREAEQNKKVRPPKRWI